MMRVRAVLRARGAGVRVIPPKTGAISSTNLDMLSFPTSPRRDSHWGSCHALSFFTNDVLALMDAAPFFLVFDVGSTGIWLSSTMLWHHSIQQRRAFRMASAS